MNCPRHAYLGWGDLHWPAFHLADVFVLDTIGLLPLGARQPDKVAKPRGRTDVG